MFHLLIEQLQVFIESKDHLIKKLKGLDDSEKDQVIAFFKKKPNLEGKIDWNNKKLTFADFKDVMDVTKTERKRKVKHSGISGLQKNKDYIQLKTPDGVMNAYVPLGWEASKLIASSNVGGCSGKWCIAYQKDKSYWKDYIHNRVLTPVYFVGDNKKFALMLQGKRFDSFWDQFDNVLGRGKLVDVGMDVKDFDSFIKSNSALLNKARKILDKDLEPHWLRDGIRKGTIKIRDAHYRISENGDVRWMGGTWISGTWEDGAWEKGTWLNGVWEKGEWEDGTWKNGTWKDGLWWDGTWEKGTWEKGSWTIGMWEDGIWKGGTFESGWWDDGVWKGGTWKDGTWRNGTWEKGTWLNGVWEKGTWKGGVWYDGSWENGTWENGEWHDGDWDGGVWEDGIWRSGTWVNGIWKNGRASKIWWEGGVFENGTFVSGFWDKGIFKSGTWEDGIWKNGTWENGTWKKGSWDGGTWKGGTWVTGTDGNGKVYADPPSEWNK